MKLNFRSSSQIILFFMCMLLYLMLVLTINQGMTYIYCDSEFRKISDLLLIIITLIIQIYNTQNEGKEIYCRFQE